MTANFEKYLTSCQHCLFFHLNYHMYSYQGSGWRSWKNPPVGPPSGRAANQTIVSAPSSTDRDAAGPPMRLRTQPRATAFTSTLAPRAASPTMRVTPFSTALEAE